MIVWMKNMFKGGNSLNNYKKDPDVLVKMNGNNQTIMTNDESFQWVLPDGEIPNGNIIIFEDFQKKNNEVKEIHLPKGKNKRKAEIILLIFFAVIVGGIFGTSLLKVLPESAESVEHVSSNSIILEPIEVFVEQAGVFSDIKGAEKVKDELESAVILERDKFYVLTSISKAKADLDGSKYIKSISTDKVTLDNVDVQTRNKYLAMSELLNSLLDTQSSETEWLELQNRLVEIEGIDNMLLESSSNLIEEMKKDRKSQVSKQTLLQFFVDYDKFIRQIKGNE